MAAIWKHFKEGGWGMWPILFWSVCVFGIIIERSLYLSAARITKDAFLSTMEKCILAGDVQSAVKKCAATPAPMAKIVQAGLLHGQRGHHGGFRLARAPATIRVADVLQAADVALTSGGCAFGFARCDAAAPCPLHDTYASLHLMLQAWARSTTLADIDLHRLPALPAPEPA